MKMDRGITPVKPDASANSVDARPIEERTNVTLSDGESSKEITTNSELDANLGLSKLDGSKKAIIDFDEQGDSSVVIDTNKPPNDESSEVASSGKDYSQGVISALQKENEALKEKVVKLKNLLSRSAAASKSVSTELNVTKGKLDEANANIARLTIRCESLANRPTHLDLLANFEARFDAAVLSIENHKDIQSGGENSGGASHVSGNQKVGSINIRDDEHEHEKVSNELYEAKSRIDTLLLRAAKLEESNEKLLNEREEIDRKLLSLQDEIRIRTDTEQNLKKQLQNKSWELEEMQIEIDLVTKASVDANVRATESIEKSKAAIVSKEYVNQLEQKVKAMEEWALASTDAKRIAVNRCIELEEKLSALNVIPKSLSSVDNQSYVDEQVLWIKSSSLVVGAGDSVAHLVELGQISKPIDPSFVLLRYKIDISPADSDIVFSIYKGTDRHKHSVVIDQRRMHGGGAGDVDGVFDNSTKICTLIFCNRHSWIRPRTIKFHLQAVIIC